MRVIGYADALAESAENRRHLLLGNGFSIAASPDFRYRSLFEEAFGAGDERLRQIFGSLATTDFEQVLSRLDDAQTVLASYPDAQPIAAQIQADRTLIARRLIEVITRIHPGSARDLDDRRYESVAGFLQEMRRPNDQNLAGRIYTTNYDLLLYWATMRNWGQIRTRDGFGDGIDGLVWSEGGQQSVFHLHGALHMFVGPDGSITKLVWDRPLIDQIGGRIDRDMLPLFVTEGTSAQKLQRIAESPYLRHALSSFETSCGDPHAVLFVFGSALKDAHIANLVADGHLERVYASVTDVERARADMAELEARWRERRRVSGHPEVQLILFAAAEAAPWG